jgi:UDP-glucose 4-epimerase
MNILITGICGFIGSHLAERFRNEGHDVSGVDNLETGRFANSPVAFEHIDIADRQDFYNVANRTEPDLVVHCAASYKDPNKWHTDTDSNVTGTINAALVAKHHDAKLVYFQTGLPPISSYAITKIAAEHFVRLSGQPHLIFRLANVYGPRNVSGPIPAFFKRISAHQECTVVATVRDVVFIRDLVDCVTLALDRGYTGTYDVCSGENTTILAQWQAVSDALPVTTDPDPFDPRHLGPPMLVPAHPDDVQPDVNPENGVPGWKPTVGLTEGVAEAVAWYQRHGVEQTFTHLAVKT